MKSEESASRAVFLKTRKNGKNGKKVTHALVALHSFFTKRERER